MLLHLCWLHDIMHTRSHAAVLLTLVQMAFIK